MKRLENIPESNARTLTISLEDGDGEAALPTLVEWRLVCADDNDASLSEWTTVTASVTAGPDGNSTVCSVTIDVPATLHEMQTEADREDRQLCVSADRGTADEFNETFLYYVERSRGRSA